MNAWRSTYEAGGGSRSDSLEYSSPKFWLLEPAASPVDPRWQDRPIWRWVVIAAPSAAFARRTAERWALPALPPQIGNESESPRAGFLDEKLYHVRPVAPAPGWLYSLGPNRERVVDAALLRAAPGDVAGNVSNDTAGRSPQA
jgi:hypothetical protein